ALLRDGDEDLVFITSDARLLRFNAALVRPQGRAGGGVAGVRVDSDSSVVFFGAVPAGAEDASVVTVSGTSSALPGTQTGLVKVTPFAAYPTKGRATGGVRCHRFLKGEDALVLAWAGAGPPHAAASTGVPVELPEPAVRRAGSRAPRS